MGYVYRKVLFYQLQIFDTSTGKRNRITGSMKNLFNGILTKEKAWKERDEEEFKLLSKVLVPASDNQITIDIIKYDDEIAFFRMGHAKDINSYHKRNEKDLSTSKITLESDEYLEVFSYFLLEFENGIISYMYSKSAPNVKNFEYLFENQILPRDNKRSLKLAADIISIPNDDVISVLKNITYFSALDIKLTIPAKDLFERQGIKSSERDYLKLASLDSEKVCIQVVGGDDKIKNNQYKELRDTITELYESKGGDIEKLEIRAGIDNRRVEKINLFDEQFNRQIHIKYEPRSTYIPISNIYSELKYIYNDIKPDLLNRIDAGGVRKIV